MAPAAAAVVSSSSAETAADAPHRATTSSAAAGSTTSTTTTTAAPRRLFIDPALCHPDHSALPTSTLFGPATASEDDDGGGPGGSSWPLYSWRRSGEHRRSSTGGAAPAAGRLSRTSNSDAGGSAGAAAASSAGGASSSSRHATFFGDVSTPSSSSSGDGGTGRVVAAATPRASTHRASVRACVGSSSSCNGGSATPRSSSRSSIVGVSLHGTGSSGPGGTSSSGGGSAAAPGRPLAAAAARHHYGAWFLPTQDWFASKHASGSTWCRETQHIARVEQQQQVAKQLGLLVDEPAATGKQLAGAAAPAGSGTPRTSSMWPAQAPSVAARSTATASGCAHATPTAAAARSGALMEQEAFDEASDSLAWSPCSSTRSSSCGGGGWSELSPTSARHQQQQQQQQQQPPISPPASAAAKTPRSELGLCRSGLRGPWMGSKTGAALLAAEQAQEAQEEEAALTEAQYYQQLHALAAQQAHLHAELRGTFVLKAYKEYLASKGLRQPVSLRRLPTPTDADILATAAARKAQLLRELEVRQQRSTLAGGACTLTSSSGRHKAQQKQEQQQQQQQPTPLREAAVAAAAATPSARVPCFAAAIAAAAAAGNAGSTALLRSQTARCCSPAAAVTGTVTGSLGWGHPAALHIPAVASSSGGSSGSSRRSRSSSALRLETAGHKLSGLAELQHAQQHWQQQLQGLACCLSAPQASLDATEWQLLQGMLTCDDRAAAAAGSNAVAARSSGRLAALLVTSSRLRDRATPPPPQQQQQQRDTMDGTSSIGEGKSESDDAECIDWDLVDLAEPSAACAAKASQQLSEGGGEWMRQTEPVEAAGSRRVHGDGGAGRRPPCSLLAPLDCHIAYSLSSSRSPRRGASLALSRRQQDGAVPLTTAAPAGSHRCERLLQQAGADSPRWPAQQGGRDAKSSSSCRGQQRRAAESLLPCLTVRRVPTASANGSH